MMDGFIDDSELAVEKRDTWEEDRDYDGEKNAKTLFVKNIPENCTVSQIKALSSDIKNVRLKHLPFNKKSSTGYAYLEFDNEAVADKNYKDLQKSMIQGKELVVDYCKYQTIQKQSDDFDPLRLYIAGIPIDGTESDVRKLFPEATDFVLPMRKKDNKTFGYGFVGFSSAEVAKQSHDKCQGSNINGSSLKVLFAKRQTDKGKKKKAKKESDLTATTEIAKEDDDSEKNSWEMSDSCEELEGDADDDEMEAGDLLNLFAPSVQAKLAQSIHTKKEIPLKENSSTSDTKPLAKVIDDTQAKPESSNSSISHESKTTEKLSTKHSEREQEDMREAVPGDKTSDRVRSEGNMVTDDLKATSAKRKSSDTSDPPSKAIKIESPNVPLGIIVSEKENKRMDTYLVEKIFERVRNNTKPPSAGGKNIASFAVNFGPVEIEDLADSKLQELISKTPSISFCFSKQSGFEKKKGYGEAHVQPNSNAIHGFLKKLFQVKLIENQIEISIFSHSVRSKKCLGSFVFWMNKCYKLLEIIESYKRDTEPETVKKSEDQDITKPYIQVDNCPVGANYGTLKSVFPFSVWVDKKQAKTSTDGKCKSPLFMKYRSEEWLQAVCECCTDFKYEDVPLTITSSIKNEEVKTTSAPQNLDKVTSSDLQQQSSVQSNTDQEDLPMGEEESLQEDRQV